MQKISRIGIWLILILIFLFQIQTQAQSKKYFVITGRIVPEAGDAGTGVIEIKKNDKDFTNIDIPKNGRFRFELEFFNEYQLIFKYPGHFNKIILVSTEIPKEVWDRDNDFPPFPMIVQMLQEFEGIDKSFTLKPQGRIFYQKGIDNFDKESFISDIQFQEQLETAKAQANQVQKEVQSISKENAQDLAAKQKDFDQLIKEADTHYQRGEYQMALLKYLEARKLFPEKAYPNDRVAELQDLVKALEITAKQKADLEQKYQTAISKANGFFDQKTYISAKPLYEEAIQYKPGDVFANGRINEINQLLALQEKQKQYADLIAQADNNYKSKNFDQAIKLADQAMAANDLQKAKMQYQEALKIKSGEAYPKTKLDEIARTESNEIRFNELIANADQLFTAQNFSESLDKYKEAISLKAAESYPKKRIKEIEGILGQIAKDQAQKDKNYQLAISQADKLLDKKDFTNAQAEYRKAIELKPEEIYPKDQLSKIDDSLARQEAEIKLRQDYNQAVTEAENLFKSKELAKAKDAFLKADNLIPSEPVPPKRISEINDLLAEQLRKDSALKATMEAYQNAIQRADKHFGNKDYSSARLVYNEALQIKSDEQYPVNQIALIEKLLTELNDQQYKSAIALADNDFSASKFDEAITSYQEALKIKKNDPYATQKLKEIDQKKASLVAENIRLKKIQDDYNAIIAGAETDFKNKEYLKSKGKYQKALSLKPAEIQPKEQIAKIDQILTDLQKEESVNTQYVQHMNLAQAAFGSNKLKEARDEYQKANNLKPSEPIPPARMAEIDKMIARQTETAQLAAMEETQRLAKEKADKDAYGKAIAAADQSFAEKQFSEARSNYINALGIFQNEKYPKEQIAKIDELLRQQQLDKELALQKSRQDSLQKVRDRLFELSISSAKEYEQNKQYEQAIVKYGEAIQVNPAQKSAVQKLINAANEKLQFMAKQDLEYKRLIKLADDQYATSKLEEAVVQYNKALDIKNDEEYPKKQIAEIQAILTSREQNYTSSIQKADRAFDSSDWQNAKAGYLEAIAIKPKEVYPVNRLKEVNQKIAEANLVAKNKEAEDKAYNEAMGKAEKAYKEDQFSSARIQFQVAQSLKPNEKLPAERIKAIDILIDQRNKDRLAEIQRELDEKYGKAISVADISFRDKSYSIANLQYKQASLIKPEETYPKDQMALCDKLLSEAKPLETYVSKSPETETAKPSIKPVYNPEETAQATEARANSYQLVSSYDDAIKRADDAFGIKDYSVARFFYLKASDIKPVDEYPKNQVELIRKLIDSQLSANDVTGYDLAISKADDAFVKRNYSIAKFYYYKAIEIKSWEKYPKDRINEILLLTNSMLSEKEEKEYRDFLAKADEAFYSKDITIARFYYNKAIAIKRDENYPQIKLKDIQKLIEQNKLELQNQEYQKIIDQADQALQAENFSIARFNYNKALTLKPDEKYPKDQLKRIKEALEKQ